MDPRSQYCSWLITFAETYNVSLSFKELTIPSCNDTFLRIYDGPNNTAPLLGTYCGSNASTEIVVSSSTNSLYIVSNSGSAKNIFAFHAQYNGANLTECRRTMTGLSGSFRSHKAAVSEMDPRSQYCSWLITLAETYIISLSFKELIIPSCNDTFLRIYDGSNGTAPLLGTYCGSNASTEVVVLSSTNSLYIVSNSGSYERRAKNIFTFHAQYNATNLAVKEKTGSTIIIIATTVSVVVFCIVIIVLLITYKRRKRAPKLSTPVNIQLADATPKESLPIDQNIRSSDQGRTSDQDRTSDQEEVGDVICYVIPIDERGESYEDKKMGENLPDYEALDQSKREADHYQTLMKT
ncbi:Hypothetical predicted protein [Paramuricea clavata]|uniref:Uncharacterized protein n=1 Tax=Paramuricea clavata TaxID=317549 RepID=A0A7D9K4G5_PARCT|nr:Hypothetical predicted protein [Paramuricea clavata]